MAQVELTWIEQQRFLGVDGAGHSIVLSGPDDVGVRPAENLLIALGACAAYEVVAILKKQRLDLRRLAVSVGGEQAARPPRAYTRIHLRFTVAAPGLRAEQLARAVNLSLNKYCPVRASLSPAIAVTFEGVVEA